jgi:hypothetical protein
MKLAYKNLFAVVFIITILVAFSGCTSTSNNTTKNTTNITEKNSTNGNNTTTYISAAKAKELAAQYTGMGVNRGTLGTPTLTTFNGVKVWKFPVNNGYYTIYIDAVTGKRVQ